MGFKKLEEFFRKITAGWFRKKPALRDAEFQLALLTVLYEINSNLDSIASLYRKQVNGEEK